MKHTINLDLQQITDLGVIFTDLVTRADKAFRDASNRSDAARNLRAMAANEKNDDIRIGHLKEVAANMTAAAEIAAECERFMMHANVINSILIQIKKNG